MDTTKLPQERKSTSRDHRRYELFARVKNADKIDAGFWADSKSLPEQSALEELDSITAILSAHLYHDYDEYLRTTDWKDNKRPALETRKAELMSKFAKKETKKGVFDFLNLGAKSSAKTDKYK